VGLEELPRIAAALEVHREERPAPVLRGVGRIARLRFPVGTHGLRHFAGLEQRIAEPARGRRAGAATERRSEERAACA